MDSHLPVELPGVLNHCSSLISFISLFRGSISFWIISANPASSLFSSSARSPEFSLSFFDVCVVAAIVLFLFCLFRGGLRTSSGLLEAGLRHLFGAIVLGCPSCFVELALLWSNGLVPVHVSPFSTPLSLFVLLIFTNLPIFCCVNVASTELLCRPDISH